MAVQNDKRNSQIFYSFDCLGDIYIYINLFIQYVLGYYDVPDIVLGIRYMTVNKADKIPVFNKFMFEWEPKNKQVIKLLT